MPRVPAFCDNCGCAFPSGFAVSGGGTLSMTGCKSGPCPACGEMGTVPDGVFSAAGEVIRLLAGLQKTVEQLQMLANVIVQARNTVDQPNEAVEKIKREAPELNSIADALPKTRSELYGFLTVLLVAIGTVIAGAALYKDSSPSEAEIQEMIDSSIEKSFEERSNINRSQLKSSPKKQGRNEACLCGSGNKYKRCCGLLI